MIVLGDKRIHAGVQPLNIQLMPSFLNDVAMTDPIEALPDAFMICRLARGEKDERVSVEKRKSVIGREAYAGLDDVEGSADGGSSSALRDGTSVRRRKRRSEGRRDTHGEEGRGKVQAETVAEHACAHEHALEGVVAVQAVANQRLRYARGTSREKGARSELRGVHEDRTRAIGSCAAEECGCALFPDDAEDAVEAAEAST